MLLKALNLDFLNPDLHPQSIDSKRLAEKCMQKNKIIYTSFNQPLVNYVYNFQFGMGAEGFVMK